MQPFTHLSLRSGSRRSGRVLDQAPTCSKAASLVLAGPWTRAPPPCPERPSRPGAGTHPPGPCCLWFPASARPARPDPSRRSSEGHACEFMAPWEPPWRVFFFFPPFSSEVMRRQSEITLKTLPFQLMPRGDCVQRNNSFVAPAELVMNCSLKKESNSGRV